MLRVCGVTFDHTTNYGSCLQAYALQKAIESIEIDGEACKYDLLPLSKLKVKKKSLQKNPIKILKRAILNRIHLFRRNRFIPFEKKYMHEAECRSYAELPDLNRRYDAFVCGSDVIWNFSYTYAEPAYFLNFAENYRFSYAASFGKADLLYEFDHVRLNENSLELYQKYISRLNSVSVRETSAVKNAERFTVQKVEHVCDPVMLLTAEEWSHIAGKDYPKKPYIFAYNTSIKPNFKNFLEKLQKQTGLTVIHVTWEERDAIKQRALTFPSPEKWLGLLKNAEYVVTNSFHATAFSAIWHKKFFTVMQDDKMARTNVRLYDFLEMIGLSDRIFTKVEGVIPVRQPNFEHADDVIRQLRARSKQYLTENLKAAAAEKKKKENEAC